MNKAVCFLAIFSCLVISKSHAQFTFATDNASNYGGSWLGSSDGGSGFGGWGFTTGANSGSFLGNPANNGISNTAMSDTAFGMYASGNEYANRSRGFDVGMGIGDVFTFDWGMNWDAVGGSKGFDLKAGGTSVFNINNGGSSTITVTGAAANANYGYADPNGIRLHLQYDLPQRRFRLYDGTRHKLYHRQYQLLHR